jgi:hypothetical protein
MLHYPLKLLCPKPSGVVCHWCIHCQAPPVSGDRVRLRCLCHGVPLLIDLGKLNLQQAETCPIGSAAVELEDVLFRNDP